jgi:hypothetical protein
MFNKFQQLFDNIMEDMNAAGFPGGVFGDGPGNVTTDPNIYAAMSIAGKPSVKGPKKRKKSRKKSKKFPIIRRNLQRTL